MKGRNQIAAGDPEGAIAIGVHRPSRVTSLYRAHLLFGDGRPPHLVAIGSGVDIAWAVRDRNLRRTHMDELPARYTAGMQTTGKGA